MAKKGFKPKKGKYDGLAEEFKAKVQAADEEGIRKIISEVALTHQAVQEAKESDTDYQEAKERLQSAGELYRANAKETQLRISFCRDELTGRGKQVPTA
jgi:hypothetical protein